MEEKVRLGEVGSCSVGPNVCSGGRVVAASSRKRVINVYERINTYRRQCENATERDTLET